MIRRFTRASRDHLWHILPATICLGAYLATLAPGVYAFDSAELATGAYSLGIVHPTGYPTYLLLGKLITYLPIGSIAYRVNLLSAVLGSLTVWMVARVIHRLTDDKLASALGALSLGFLHAFWTMSVVAEVYTLHTLLFALAISLLLGWMETQRRALLLALALVLGLSLTNHVSSALLLPGFAIVVLMRGDRRDLIRFAPAFLAVFVMGLIPYAYLPLRDMASPELNYVRSYYGIDLQSWQGLYWMVSGQAYRIFAFSYDLGGYLQELLGFGASMLRGYTALGLILAGVGAFTLYRRENVLGLASIWWFGMTGLFFSGYAVADKYTMFLAAYVVVSIWLGVGLSWLRSEPVPVLSRLPSIPMNVSRRTINALSIGMLISVFVFTIGRVDKSHASEGDLFARQVLSGLEPGAVVMAQWSSAVTLEYYRDVEGLRPDVEIFNRSRYAVAQYYRLWEQGHSHDVILKEIAALERAYVEQVEQTRPVYGTEYDPILASSYEYLPVGNVYRIVPRSPIEHLH